MSLDPIPPVPEKMTNEQTRIFVKRLVKEVNHIKQILISKKQVALSVDGKAMKCKLPHHERLTERLCKDKNNSDFTTICDQVLYLDDKGKPMKEDTDGN